MAQDRRFVTLDVFADAALSGNPLAVVLDAQGLDDTAMQAVAREFNLSETVFVSPPANPAHRAALRIFTPKQEVPFAGHPTVGTAVLLAGMDWGEDSGRDGIMVLEEGVGAVRVGVRTGTSEAAGFAEFDLPEMPHELSHGSASRSDIASAVGLMASDIGFDNHRPTVFSVGGGFAFVPVRDTEALARARPVRALWSHAFAAGRGMAYLYARPETKARGIFQARMFAPPYGIDEDPATGSAAAAFAGVAAKFEPLADGGHSFSLHQGIEMGRPGRIALEVEIEAGRVRAARVGGDAVIVSRGTMRV